MALALRKLAFKVVMLTVIETPPGQAPSDDEADEDDGSDEDPDDVGRSYQLTIARRVLADPAPRLMVARRVHTRIEREVSQIARADGALGPLS